MNDSNFSTWLYKSRKICANNNQRSTLLHFNLIVCSSPCILVLFYKSYDISSYIILVTSGAAFI